MIDQKLDYLHNNSVATGIVDVAESYFLVVPVSTQEGKGR